MCLIKLNHCGPDLIKSHIMKLTLAFLCAVLQVISAAQVEIKPRGVEIKPRVSDDNIDISLNQYQIHR